MRFGENELMKDSSLRDLICDRPHNTTPIMLGTRMSGTGYANPKLDVGVDGSGTQLPPCDESYGITEGQAIPLAPFVPGATF
jgi:hypothetical protein